VVLQPMARQLHPLLAQQLESAGVDLPSLGHHGSSLLSLLHEISRTYERANVPCPPSAPLPRSRPSSLGAATAVHACNTATSSPGPSVSSGDPVIAHAEVLENLGGNPEVLKRILAKFRTRASSCIETLRRLHAEQEWLAFRREAHSLKGSSGYIAAWRLHKAAFTLQRVAEATNEGKPPEMPVEEAMAALEAEIGLVLAEIDKTMGEE